MAKANDGTSLSPQRQDVLRRLSEGMGRKVDKLNLLDLGPARDHFAGEWPRLSGKVRSIVEGTLRKCLHESDTFTALDDMGYAVLTGQSKPCDVREMLERVSDEISRRIMGEGSHKVFISFATADADATNGDTPAAPAAKVSNIERIIGDIVSVEDDFSFDGISLVVLPMIGQDRRPSTTQYSTPFSTIQGGRQRYGYDCLPPEPDTTLVAELDALTAERAAKHLAELERLGKGGLVQLPVHRSTLSSRKYRELYLKICRGLFSRYKNKVIFDIHGIEDGTPSNRVTEHMQWLRPYGRAIAATVDLDFSTLNSFSGAALHSLGVSLDGVEDEAVESKLSRFLPRLRSVEAKTHVHGLRNQGQLALCMSLMVGAMDGSIIPDEGVPRLELVRNGH